MQMPSFRTSSKSNAKRASAPPAAPAAPVAAQTTAPRKLYVRALLKKGTDVVHKRTALSVKLSGAQDNWLTTLSKLDGAWDSLVKSGQVVQSHPKTASGVKDKYFVLNQTFRKTTLGRTIPTYHFDEVATAAYQKHIRQPREEGRAPQEHQVVQHRTTSSGSTGATSSTPVEEEEFKLYRRSTIYAHMAAKLTEDQMKEHERAVRKGQSERRSKTGLRNAS